MCSEARSASFRTIYLCKCSLEKAVVHILKVILHHVNQGVQSFTIIWHPYTNMTPLKCNISVYT